MKITEILVEGPFDSMKSAQTANSAAPDHIATSQKAGTKSGILKGLDKWAGTNAFGDNKVKSVADIDQDIDRLDINAKKHILAKLQQELGNQADTAPVKLEPTKPTAPPTK
jgi:hypothetical protein